MTLSTSKPCQCAISMPFTCMNVSPRGTPFCKDVSFPFTWALQKSKMCQQYLTAHQSIVCTDQYQNVDGSYCQPWSKQNIGQSIILLATFTNNLWDMHHHYQDAMATVVSMTDLIASLWLLATKHSLLSMKHCSSVRYLQNGQIMWSGCSEGNSASCYLKCE